MEIPRSTIVLTSLALTVWGCTTTDVAIPGGTRPFSMIVPVSPALSTGGVWVAADCRVLRFSDEDFLRALNLHWQSAPVQENRAAVKFAQLTTAQVLQLGEKGKGKFTYLPSKDAAGFLLVRMPRAPVAHEPRFCLPTGEGAVVDVGIAARPDRQGRSLDLTVTASEGDPRRGPVSEWKGTGRVPLTGSSILIDIPTVHDDPAGTQSRVMVMLVPQTFVWKNGRMTTVFPWDRARIIVIDGRTIRTTWLPPKDLRLSVSRK